MKSVSRLLITLLVLSFSTYSWATDVDKFTSGGWGDPSQNGHGYSIEVINEDLAIIYWYVYNPDGTSTFLLTVGHIDGDTISGNTNYYSGMIFGEFDPSVLEEVRWGTVTITFHDCNTATLSYSSTMSHNGVPFGSGTVELQRLVSLHGMHCTDTPVAGNFQISVEGPDGLSAGAGVVFENGDFAYFLYGESHAEVVLAALSPTGANTFSMNATAYSVFGGTTDLSGTGMITEDGLEIDLGPDTSMTAASVASFRHRLPAQDLAGTYSITDVVDDSHAGTLTVSPAGVVSGSTTDGCDISGIFLIPNENFNQFFVDVDLSNCQEPMRLIGAGAFDFDENIIVAVTSDGTTGSVWELE